MRRRDAFCLLISAALGSAAYAQAPSRAAPREVLVKLASRSAAAIQNLSRDQSLDVETAKPVGGSGFVRLRSRTRDTNTLIQSLSQRPDVQHVEPNYVLTRQKLPGESLASLWGLTRINAPAAWDKTTGSRSIVIGVIDSGADYNHTDLRANIWTSTFTFTANLPDGTVTCTAGAHGYNAIANTCDPMDDQNHGTHVAGIIGAEANNMGVVGTNWFTTILPIKFLDASGSGFTSDAVEAITFARELKKLGVNLRVLSNSWGGGSYSQALYDEISLAGSEGMLFVVAAGNAGSNIDTTPFYPAGYNLSNIIAVTATDSADTLPSWANYGAHTVHMAAPGVDILSTIRNDSFATMSGTSMAAPHVAGAAALVLSAPGCTNLTVSELKTVLLNGVDLVPSLAGKTVTGGRLNMDKAVSSCGSPADFNVTVTPSSRLSRQGQMVTFSVSVSAIAGFSSPVVLSVSGCPPQSFCAFSKNPTLPGSVLLAVASTSSTPLGTYSIQVTGASGSLVHSAGLSLVVKK